MKKTVLPLLLLTFSYCSTNKNTLETKSTTTVTVESSCPENGKCTFEIIQNKSLLVKTDALGTTYFELVDNLNKVVFKYKFDLNVDKTLQDAGYTEEVLFEMDKDYTDFSISGKELQHTKLLFKVMCFCRGKAGSYKVFEGNITKKGKSLSIALPKIIDDQKTNQVKINL